MTDPASLLLVGAAAAVVSAIVDLLRGAVDVVAWLRRLRTV